MIAADRRADVTVLAPHPDDEVFGVGGIMRQLVTSGRRVRLVAVTDGEAAYGTRPMADRTGLVAIRAKERTVALDALGIGDRTEVIRLGLPDGQLSAHEPELAALIDELAGTVLFATWRHDGHPDHEAVGRAAAAVAHRRALCLVEYAVWAGHRHRLERRGRSRTHRVQLDPAAIVAKVRAVEAFTSQIGPSPDGRPVVPAELVDHLGAGREVVFT